MKRTSSDAGQVCTSYDCRAEYPSAAEKKTFADLLVNHTVDQILRLAQFAVTPQEVAAFFKEELSSGPPDLTPELTALFLTLDEPNLNLTLLKLYCLDLCIVSSLIASNILKALKLEPKSVFSNLSLSIDLRTAIVDESFLPAVVEILHLNNGIRRIEIYFFNKGSHSLGPLFMALSKIANLDFATKGPGVMEQTYINGLLDMIAVNKTIQHLSLNNLSSTTNAKSALQNFLKLFKLLSELPQLLTLTLPDITEECQAMLGNFINNSYSIKTLRIGLETAVVTPLLIEGFEGNRSLRNMEINVAAVTRNVLIEDSILPFFDMIEKNGSTIISLDLKMHRCNPEIISEQINIRRQERNNESALSALIANNSCLHSLSVVFPDIAGFDPLPIAEALEKNTCLEELNIRFFNSTPGGSSHVACTEHPSQPEFLAKIANNRTLTKILFEDHDKPSQDIFRARKLDEITCRNVFFQKYWCSEAYFVGAASAFLGALGMPGDPALFIAKHLMSQKPVIAARALAIVNKATSERALAARRDQNKFDGEQALVASKKDANAVFNDMVTLLGNIATTKHDFSDDELRSIADNKHFDWALLLWMDLNESFYIYLVSRFIELVGVNELKRRLIDQFLTSTGSQLERFVRMLEQSFLPDQQHLVYIIENQLAYHSIDCASVKAFVGYGITNAFASQEVIDWCIGNQQPELYFAYASKFPSTFVELMEMPPDFREIFISKMLAFKSIGNLLVEDDQRVGFLLVKDVLLVEKTGLEQLFLTNTHLSRRDFTLLMDNLAKNRELRVFQIALLKEQLEFSLSEKILETLEANPFLESLSLALASDHFEFDVLVDLARADPRFKLEELNDEDSD